MRLVCRSWRNIGLAASAAAFISLAGSLFATSSTETAVANGDTRTLHLYHTHTGESIDATFRVDGHYDPAVLGQLNHFLRDWRNNDQTTMDPRLFDTLWEVYRTAGATDPIQIYSAYRSPETNAMLRRRSRAVAEHSQHMLGKAMDTTIPGFPMHRIREIGMKLQRGGVGWYPSSNFVHLDVGGVRSWPRMSYDQLAGLFPDGKTVHIASNGQVLPGYEAARAEIAAHGGVDIPPPQESQGFFAWLFGGESTASTAHEDEEDRRTPVAAAPARQPAPQPQVQVQQSVIVADAGGASAFRAQVEDDQIGAPATPRASEARADATTEPAKDAGTNGIVLPLPPHRPADLVAEAEIPLPPVRPGALSRLQQGSVHFADTAAARYPAGVGSDAVPSLRKSLLPAIIMQGDRGRAAANALAFADPSAGDGISAKRGTPVPPARPASLKAVGLRAAFHSGFKTSVPDVVPRPAIVATSAPSPVAGPHLMGLRKAARLMAEKEAL